MKNSFFKKPVHLGIIKGGQLGRMLLEPALRFGVVPHIMDNDDTAPCRPYCQNFVVGDAGSFEDVYSFGKNLDAVTVEFEHVNLDALKKLRDEGVRVFPSPEVLEIVQDKGKQKEFYRKNNFPTAEFVLVENLNELKSRADFCPAVQKSRLAGYDGKGVSILRSPSDFDQGFDCPSVLEKMVEIKKEISVIVARNSSGQIETFPTVEMVFHQDASMLDYLFSPADISDVLESQAIELARSLAEKLDLVGLLAVELFITKSDEILINEIAPRPHNSGHHTIEANQISQYEQHLRAIFDLPLGSGKFLTSALMMNLVGDSECSGEVSYQGLEKFLNQDRVFIHLYGKKETRPFRKMGHITIIKDDLKESFQIMKQIKQEVRVVS